MRFFNILFVVVVNIFYIQLINGAALNRSLTDGYTNELDVLEDVIKEEVTRFLSKSKTSAKCNETALTCKLCVSFRLGRKHELCLIVRFRPDKLGASARLTYNSINIWNQKVQFNSMCTDLPEPLNEVKICLEVYNSSITEKEICLRTEITLILRILSIDFNCVKYETEKGLFFDSSIESKSKALMNINVHEGKSIVSFNNPTPWEIIKPFVIAIITEQKNLKLENKPKQMTKESEQ